jgi:hypothetical protein
MEIQVYLMMFLGFVLIVVWIGSSMSRSHNETQRKKNEEIENKIKLQTFVITVKKKYPNFKIRFYDRIAVFEGPLYNENNKIIGNIEINGHRSLTYKENEPYYQISFLIKINEKSYEAKKNFVQENPEIISTVLSDLSREVMENQDLKKRIIATTY